MNIFYLDDDIETCARYHCDKHVIKMILESAQILCTVLWINQIPAPYRSTHKHHPCVIVIIYEMIRLDVDLFRNARCIISFFCPLQVNIIPAWLPVKFLFVLGVIYAQRD